MITQTVLKVAKFSLPFILTSCGCCAILVIGTLLLDLIVTQPVMTDLLSISDDSVSKIKYIIDIMM